MAENPQEQDGLHYEDVSDSDLTGNITFHNYPVLPNEEERLEALRSYHILDTAEEKDFDDLTTLASAICQTPIALVSLVDHQRQWFKSHKGLSSRETPREYSFCAHAIAEPHQPFIVTDAALDMRFSDNPLVTGETNIVFYAGIPLVNQDGFALGSLCVIDHQKRKLDDSQLEALKVLAQQVIDKLELKRKINQLEAHKKSLQEAFNQLRSAQQQVDETEIKFRNVVDQAPVAISILKGRELKIESANAQILDVWGKNEGILNKPLAEALPELRGQPFLAILDNVFTSGKAYVGFEAQVSLERAGIQNDCFFNFVYQPIKNHSGYTHSIMVVATEVTEQVKSRIAMEETNERLQIALEAGKLGSYDLELESGHMACTLQCKANFGRNTEEPFNFAELMHAIVPEHRSYVNEQINAAIMNHSTYVAEYVIQWPDGSKHWISASGKPKFDEQGNAVRMIGVTQNISDRKEFEQRKDDFLSIASHELKTPITTLKANLQLLERLKDNPQHPMLPRLIESSSKSMGKINSLVDELLNVNRFSSGEFQLNKTTFNLWEMLDLCCGHVRLEGNYKLTLTGDKQLEVEADEHRIDQVLVNFVNNAIKYAPDSKEIKLRVEKTGDSAKISVQDYGPGIEATHLPKLFDRYWRASHTGANYSGLGLGLYICAEIIKRHDGKIGADSTIGEGSTFWFTLPLNYTKG